VTDGGAKDKLGSFGWVISTTTRKLWKGRGYAKGSPMDSHRAEGIGRVAGLLFLKRFCEFHKITHCRKSLSSFCDNKDAVRLAQLTVNPWYSPNTTMRPNWDAYSQAFQLQKDLQNIMKIVPCQHVKGHADKDKAFEDLTWPEELNYWADIEATKALKEHPPEEEYIWHPFPTCPAYLEVNGTIRMAKSIKLLEDWVNEQPLHEYFKKTHGWSDSTLDDINWDAFKGARRQYKYNELSYSTKLCCKWLPTFAHRCRWEEGLFDKCLTCNEVETQTHIFQCKNRMDWKREFISGLRTFLTNHNTDEQVKDGLVAGLDAWVDGCKNTHPIDPQKEIGWEQCFMGFLADDWGHRQARHFTRIGETEVSSTTWGMKLIQFLWEHGKKAWKLRNDLVHADDPASTSRFRKELETKVSDLYRQEPKLSAIDRDLLAVPLEQRLTEKTAALELWHEVNYPIIRDCVMDFEALLSKGLRDIRNFFKPTDTNRVRVRGKSRRIRQKKRHGKNKKTKARRAKEKAKARQQAKTNKTRDKHTQALINFDHFEG
jgi:hypothetical protein